MKYLLLLILLTTVGGVATTRADAPVDTHAQAATELLRMIDIEKTMAGAAAAMADSMTQQNPLLAPYRDVILKWAGGFMNWETFGPRLVTLYKETFSEAELLAITEFYKTPAGQKSLTVLPQLMHRSMELGAEVAKEHVPELQEMVRVRAAELEKLTAKP